MLKVEAQFHCLVAARKMAMQLTMLPSVSSSGCSYFCHRNRVFAASLTARRRFQPVFSISSKLSLSCDREVVRGMDCLPNPNTPWVKLPSGIDPATGLVVDSFYSLIDNQEVTLNRRDCLGVPDTAKCFAVTGEWLAFVDSNDDCPVYLTNPFFNCNDPKMGGVIRLPSMATIPSCAGVERDPQTSHVTEFNLFCSAVNAHSERRIDEIIDICEHKHMVSSIANLSITHLDPRHAECVAVALEGEGLTLAYSRIWDDTTLGWIGLQQDYDPSCESNQLVYSHAYKMFYVINQNGIEVFDLLSDRKKRSKRVLLFSAFDIEKSLERVFENEKNEQMKDLRNKTYFADDVRSGYAWNEHLVVLNDDGKSSDLLFIVRHLKWDINIGKTLHFDVFKVDFPTRTLQPVKSLEEQCVFVGADQSFSLSASKFPGLQPDSIYFTENKAAVFYHKSRKDRGIFNLANNQIEPLQQPIDNAGMGLLWISPSYIRNN